MDVDAEEDAGEKGRGREGVRKRGPKSSAAIHTRFVI